MTLRVGVIGTGAIGKTHIHRLSYTVSGARVVAVNDANEAQAQLAVDGEQIDAKVYKTGQELIEADDVDAILVASWGPTHEEFVLASIAAGKPVFCEKPLATTAEGCRRIVDAEIASGKKLVQVGFMRRYDQGYRALKQALAEGNIGAPLVLHCAHRNPSAPGFSGDMAITDSLVHELDVLRWLLDQDYVSAQVILPRSTRFADPGLQDPHVILLETAQGIRIDIESFVNCQYGYDIQCQVVGETGTANLPEPASVTLRHQAKYSRGILTDWKDRFVDAFNTEFQEWIGSTMNGEMNGPSAWDGYVVAISSDACVRAKHEARIVPIEIPQRPVFYG